MRIIAITYLGLLLFGVFSQVFQIGKERQPTTPFYWLANTIIVIPLIYFLVMYLNGKA